MIARWDSGLNRIALLFGVVGLGSVAHTSAQTSSAGVEATTVAAVEPAGVAYDSAGNLYIAVLNDHVILEVGTTGLVTTVAGTGQQGYGGDGGPATSALLDSPAGVAVDSSGNIYIADTHNNRIREISNGTITTIAGTGAAGFSGDGGAATLAQLDRPTAVSVDAAGNVYIADTNNFRIRKIAGGTITTVAGDGEQTFSGDGGPATAAGLDSPYGVAADTLTPGKFYIADTHNQRVRMVDATGNISTLAGTGVESFGGDGGTGASAGLARPWGLAVDSNDHVFLADSDNNRIREIVGATITTAAGDGEQGFAGDTAAAASAVLDTPRAAAVSAAGVLALADTHNQRVRAVSSGNINTVAGIAPPLTEGLLLSGPISGTFAGANGTLTAVFSNVGKTATGTLTLLDGGVPVSSAALASNSATFSLNSLAGGVNTLAVTYAGDANNAPSASGVFLVSVAATSQTVTFPPPPTPVVYSSGLTATLTATASSGLPVTYGVSGPATVNGSTVTYTGPGTVVITATQVGDSDYALASTSQTVIVVPVVVASGVSPSTVTLGAGSQPISVSGSGFTSTSVIQVNGTALPTTFVNSSLLTATIPAADFGTLGTLNISVYNSSPAQLSLPQTFTVTAPPLSATLSAPSTTSSGQQPNISLQLQSGYPAAISGVFTLTFTPSGAAGIDDPAIQFATGGRTFGFTIPANSTAAPSVAIQAGTVAGTITITVALTVDGVDVTPAAARSVQIVVAAAAPTVSSISFSQSGATLTVTVRGFSNPRDMTQAAFTFTAGPGTSLATTALSLPVTTLFTGWFSQAASDAYGSTFTYTQTFNLSDPTTLIQSVSVILTNSTGASAAATSP